MIANKGSWNFEIILNCLFLPHLATNDLFCVVSRGQNLFITRPLNYSPLFLIEQYSCFLSSLDWWIYWWRHLFPHLLQSRTCSWYCTRWGIKGERKDWERERKEGGEGERKEGGEGERKRKEEKEGEGETGNNTERRWEIESGKRKQRVFFFTVFLPLFIFRYS